jgi:hypothetical protein
VFLAGLPKPLAHDRAPDDQVDEVRGKCAGRAGGRTAAPAAGRQGSAAKAGRDAKPSCYDNNKCASGAIESQGEGDTETAFEDRQRIAAHRLARRTGHIGAPDAPMFVEPPLPG